MGHCRVLVLDETPDAIAQIFQRSPDASSAKSDAQIRRRVLSQAMVTIDACYSVVNLESRPLRGKSANTVSIAYCKAALVSVHSMSIKRS